VNCCDSSKTKHASAHARRRITPIAESFEPERTGIGAMSTRSRFSFDDAPYIEAAPGDTEEDREGDLTNDDEVISIEQSHRASLEGEPSLLPIEQPTRIAANIAIAAVDQRSVNGDAGKTIDV
jgi:hypothetical protein